MNNVDHLILSSTLDFSTDYVCYELKQRGKSYLRLNRDCFSRYKIKYDLQTKELLVDINGIDYIVSQDTLRSVFFRCPVFIRSNKPYPVEMQLYRSQWSSFVRNLTVFDEINWLNHPMDTYQAENKMCQLKVAQSVGLSIPKTIITNEIESLEDDALYVVKALDTPLFYEDGQEMFTYSTVSMGKEIKDFSITEAPVIIQNCISNKVDIRVTIVGDRIFPAKILKNNKGIEGDWRKTKKEDLQFVPCELPKDVGDMLLHLMSKMHLFFGGIDLAFSDTDGKYYFIEVNPTGEWGWLVGTTGYEIHKAIVDWLVK